MRVSDKSNFDFHRGNLGRLQSQSARAQEQAASNRRVTKPSDDPMAMSLALRERSRSTRADAYSRSIDAGTHRLDAADSTLGDVASALRRVRELTVQASTDTVTSQERTVIALEVRGLKDSIHSLANTKSGSTYIFAGYPHDTAPFDAAGVFVGSPDIPELEVSPGVRVATGVAGDVTFGGAGGGVDVLASLDALVLALETNDVVNIRASLTTVDQSHDQISQARGEVGARQNEFEVSQSVVDRMKDRAEVRQTELVGISSVDSILALQQAQGAFQAAVQIAAQLPGPSLVSR